MAPLQDQCPPEDFDNVILPILNDELDFEGTFATFDREPIGSASIGQVHRATLHDGTPVVVKICYPHVERLLRGDVRTVKAFAEVAQPVHVPALNEIEKQFQTEFDYRTEAEHLEVVRDNLMRAGLAGPGKPCVVPKPYRQFCTKRVLVMEELKGDKLAVALKRDLEHWANVTGKSVAELQQQADKGRTAAEFDRYIAAADAQRRVKNTWTRLYNTTAGVLPGVAKREYHSKVELPLNHAQLVVSAMYVFQTHSMCIYTQCH